VVPDGIAELGEDRDRARVSGERDAAEMTAAAFVLDEDDVSCQASAPGSVPPNPTDPRSL
jgi:hypothetical protein